MDEEERLSRTSSSMDREGADRSTPTLASSGHFVPVAEDSTTTAHGVDRSHTESPLCRLLSEADAIVEDGSSPFETYEDAYAPGGDGQRGTQPPPVGPFDYSRNMRFTCLLADATGPGAFWQSNAFEDVVARAGADGGHPLLWIDVRDPCREDLSRIAQMHAVHPLTAEDIEMQDEREKCEVFHNYVFLCLRTVDHGVLLANHPAGAVSKKVRQYAASSRDGSPFMGAHADPADGASRTLYAVLFDRLVITFHYGPLGHVGRVLHRLQREGSVRAPTADWVLYALLDDVVDEFQTPLLEMQHEVDAIDEMVLLLTHRELPDMMRRIGRGRKRATHLLRLLRPKTSVLRVLTGNRCVPAYLRPGTLVYLRDVGDHVLSSLAACEEYGETLNRSHSNYLAQISIELGEASNELNVVMKKISAVAAVFLPVSVISGLWGMNVAVPWQPGIEASQLGPFFAIVAMNFALMFGLYAGGRRMRWW